uniref:Tyrosine-protein phosphatase domain-containing protein n=1 Tax=Timema genevievae TaxID=629358 RepID=A0A7R9JRM2_TIMGE|nr:unnamed protein product [Timema genevievae]
MVQSSVSHSFVEGEPPNVLPGLYVGNYRDSKDSLQLERFEITHIVAIHDTPRKLHLDKHYLCVMASDTPDQNLTQYFPLCNDFIHAARLRGGHVLIHCQRACGKRRKYHLVWLAGDGEIGAQIPDKCIEMIPSPLDPPKSQGVKISGRWVIFTETSSIRILAGMSRSVTVAVAYIMSVTTLNWKEALKVVRVGRSVANPNFGFQKQLQEFEAFKLLEERRRMKERFPSLLLVNQDEEQCRLMLHSYQSLILSRDLCEGDCSLGQTCPTGLCRSPNCCAESLPARATRLLSPRAYSQRHRSPPPRGYLAAAAP